MMPDIPIENETNVELTSFILHQIQREATEYFGESIRAIRVQQGTQRHRFNAKTGEVRFAFFPSEYGLSEPSPFSTETDGLGSRGPSINDDIARFVASDFVDDEEPDEAGLEDLDDASDVNVSDDDPAFVGLDNVPALVEGDDGLDGQGLAPDVDVFEGLDSDFLYEDAE